MGAYEALRKLAPAMSTRAHLAKVSTLQIAPTHPLSERVGVVAQRR